MLSFSSDPSSYAAVFPKWNDPSTWNLAAISPLAVSYVQGFGNFNINVPTNAMGAWIEDEWKITPRLTLNLGLRYDNDIGIFDPSLSLKSGIVTPRKGDNLLFAPRLGFTFDVTGSRKTVIRGGAGMFYGDILANQVIDQQIFNGQDSLQPSVGAKPGQPRCSQMKRNDRQIFKAVEKGRSWVLFAGPEAGIYLRDVYSATGQDVTLPHELV